MQAIAVAQSNVEALAARQRELEICEAGEMQPMMQAQRLQLKARDHVLQDCKDVLEAMQSELSQYFRKVVK